MKRFILLSFGFLGWAFYEMSGGADFESASDRVARLNPAPAVSVTAVDQPEEAEAVTAAAVIDTDPPSSTQVTRVSLNLTSLQEVLEEDTAAPAQDAVAETTTNIDPQSGVAVNAGLTLSTQDTPAIIPSLIAPNDTGAASITLESVAAQTGIRQEQEESSEDIRTVSGNRVNVRGGPGTDFNVVGKLVRGDAVEILEDNGDGWVLMRAVDTGEQGWLADFLLNS